MPYIYIYIYTYTYIEIYMYILYIYVHVYFFFDFLHELLMDPPRRPGAAGVTVKPWWGGSRGLSRPRPPRHLDWPAAVAAPAGDVGAVGGRSMLPTEGGETWITWSGPKVTTTVEKVSALLLASLIVVLRALLSAGTNRERRGRTTRRKERTRAPGRPKERAQTGRGRSGNGLAGNGRVGRGMSCYLLGWCRASCSDDGG